MPQEMYIYSVMAAIIGIFTVFIFLALLSFLMFAIKEIFGEKPLHEVKKASAKKMDSGTLAAGKKSTGAKGETENWVLAATVVFLTEEALEVKRSAESWKPSKEERSDPWIVFPRV